MMVVVKYLFNEGKQELHKRMISNLNKKTVLQMSLDELYAKLSTTPDGLTEKEAAVRLHDLSSNVLRKKSVRAWKVLLRQFKSSLIYLLIIASLLSYSLKDSLDGTVILIILLINTFLGFFQEYRSERFIEKLSQFITHQVRLKRESQVAIVDESAIAVGDVLIVRQGDIAPADMRVFAVTDLQVNESQLSGESVPVAKQVFADATTDQNCLLFAGSIIEKGEGIGVVYATGNATELGAIAKLSTETKKETQYEKALQSFSSMLMRIIIVSLAAVFLIKLFLSGGAANAIDLLLFIIALAVSTVPEVLPIITTLTLSRGALQLAQKHVVAKRLSSIEDLGNITILCTDKTGTLTENKMTVKEIVAQDDHLFQIFAYASIVPLKRRKLRTQNSYDDAFMSYVSETIKKEAETFSLIKEMPFDPAERRSRAIVEDTAQHKYYLLSLGAAENLFTISTPAHREHYRTDIAAKEQEGLHTFAIAYKELSSYGDDFDLEQHEREMTFLGYASLSDPLRSTAKSALRLAEKLGVAIKILTGDSKEVAGYIGRQVELLGETDIVYTGEDLEKMPAEKLRAVVQASTVFARITPEQKFAIIKTLKDAGGVVGYQGDGINDAPALKLADVAIAVNSATDIAKENADIVLLNKSLDVVINGIRSGRAIFLNINKYIRYTMTNNFGMLVAISLLYIFSAGFPILPVQLLLNNLLGDIPLALVSTDNVESQDIIRPEKHNMKGIIFVSLVLGIPTAIFDLLYYSIVRLQPQPIIETSLFVFFTLQALVIFYAVRSHSHFWKVQAPSLSLNIAFALDFVFSLAIVYIPAFQEWFSFVPLSVRNVAIIIGLIVPFFLITDLLKAWYYHFPHTQKQAI